MRGGGFLDQRRPDALYRMLGCVEHVPARKPRIALVRAFTPKNTQAYGVDAEDHAPDWPTRRSRRRT